MPLLHASADAVLITSCTWSGNSPTGSSVSIETESISVSIQAGNIDATSFLMFINGVAVTPSITVNTVNTDYTLTYTLLNDELWYGAVYDVQVQAQAGGVLALPCKFAWRFTVEAGVQSRTMGYQESQLTQLVANGFPDWSRARKSPASMAQQLINPIAVALDDARTEMFRQHNNHFLQTADRNDMDLLYRHGLPGTFEFEQRFYHDGDFEFLAPTVTGVDGLALFDVTVQDELTDFWGHVLPTRIVGGVPVYLESGGLMMSPTAGVNSPLVPGRRKAQVPGHLYVEATGSGPWVAVEEGNITFTEIKLTGTTREGAKKQSETLVFERASVIRTRRQWAEIDEVQVSALNFNADIEISIDNFAPRNSEKQDFEAQVITVDREVYPSHWTLFDDTLGTCLRQSAFIGASALDIFRGEGLVEHAEYELLGVNGDRLFLKDFCLDRNQRFLYAVSETKLYIFDKRPEYYTNFDELSSRTDDPALEIVLRPNTLSRVNGSLSLGLRQHLRTAKQPVKHWRWSVYLPGGARRYIDSAGTMHSAESSFVANDDLNSFFTQEVQVTTSLTETGTHLFVLEVVLQDGTLETVMEPYHVDFLQAVAEYDLGIVYARPPLSVPASSAGLVHAAADAVLRKVDHDMRLVLDSDDRLRVIRDSHMYLITPKYDSCVIDFETKEVYCRENYDSLRVAY